MRLDNMNDPLKNPSALPGFSSCSSTHHLNDHDQWAREVVVSPQGNQLASASEDETECGNRSLRIALAGHDAGVFYVAYRQKGDLLASSSWDKTVRLWDVAAVVQNFQSFVMGISLGTTSDGDYLVTGSEDGPLRKLQVIEAVDQCRVQWRWGIMNDTLNVEDTSIQDVHGLIQLNR